jgi:hypothetical protein
MTLRLWTIGAAALLAAVAACVVRQGDEPTSTNASSIEGGDPVNQDSNPVSILFPLSTVMVKTVHYLDDGGTDTESCTGEILTPNKILTAAHCYPTDETQVYLYPYGADAGTKPLPTPIVASGAPAIQPGAELCDVNQISSCYSNTPSTHFADLAVVPISSTINPPYHPVVLGPRGSFAASHPQGDGVKSPSSWEVGTGLMNEWISGCVKNAATLNASRSMQWVAMYHLPGNDNTGMFSVPTLWGDRGDSGGPVYEYAAGPVPSGPLAYNLILVGTLSSRTPKKCVPGATDYTVQYTSVEYGDNYDWLVNQGASVVTDVRSFGASL